MVGCRQFDCKTTIGLRAQRLQSGHQGFAVQGFSGSSTPQSVYQYFGETIRAQTSGIANEVAGKSAKKAIQAAEAAAGKADGERKEKGLDAYENK